MQSNRQTWITGVNVMTMTNLVREVGEKIVLITPSGTEVIVTILEHNKIGIEAPDGTEINIEDLN